MSSALGMTNLLSFGCLVYTLPGYLDTGIAIAASRCGATGVLNLEYLTDASLAQSAIARLLKYRRGPCGIKLDSATSHLPDETISELVRNLDVVVLTATEADRFRKLVPLARSGSCQVLLECISSEEAALGAEAGVDGLVAKGHESGGRVGEETTFILLQRLIKDFSLPVWAHGGIAVHTAAACFAGGAAGIVLDSQVILTQESTLPKQAREVAARFEGDETVCIGAGVGEAYRVYKRPGTRAVEELQAVERTLGGERSSEAAKERWREAIRSRLGWDHPESQVWLLGQDAAFAAPLAREFRNVAGIVEGLRKSVADQVRTAQTLLPLDQGSPLARSHGTEYPILQGPMTRVSDTAEFAAAVAEAGALPFLALALLRAPQVRSLLDETRKLLGSQPWGVGILGFVPTDLREEQLEVIREFRPRYAIIAGGRPDQAVSLEREGISTYLHVPAPGLLRVFLENGARRFIFEGRECGGHVGPRTSFVLWEAMIAVILEAIAGGVRPEELHVVFAGGIHDARSAAMVAAMAAPLAQSGVRIGVLMGTAYLFTEEAVRSQAIVQGFQQEAIRCSRTVLLESGAGHSTRCAETPFHRAFTQTRQSLLANGKSAEEIRNALEKLNLGRLRIASKGIMRDPQSAPDQPAYVHLSPEQQKAEGMYMIGQLAVLRAEACHISDLHQDVSAGSSRLLRNLVLAEDTSRKPTPKPCDVAIVGMSCLLPGATDVGRFWTNVLNKVDAIQEIPAERFDYNLYLDSDRKAPDKIYSKWGGFLEEVEFDPLRYGIPPAALPSIDPIQLLALEVVHRALQDAGYSDKDFPRERTSVILGLSGGLGELGLTYGVRSLLPMYLGGEVPQSLQDRLPEWTEDSFAGLLLNVTAGRVSNRFNLGGVNYSVDAACASSLAAVYLAARELENAASDMVIVGGVDTTQNPFGYLCFSSSQALSPTGRCRTFDAAADGIVISEGAVVLVLKRLKDAERDGDRIYAVIKGVAGSSDGRGRGLTAPRPEGQVLALERAYGQAGVTPASVGLVEAHGTGTVAGDAAEVASLAKVFQAAGAAPGSCVLGSVKSMIGHTKSAAGVTGLMKVALALHHKVLPPTLHVETPNSRLQEAGSPFVVNTEPMPWVAPSDDVPRRAGVSSFGFGGTNFHAVVEEYQGEFRVGMKNSTAAEWPSELFHWRANSAAELEASLSALENSLQNAQPALPDLAASVCAASTTSVRPGEGVRLSIVASSLDDLRSKMREARKALRSGAPLSVMDPRGSYLASEPVQIPKVAFLFPGQGSQYPQMMRDLALHFPEISQSIELANRVLAGKLHAPLSSYIFPSTGFTEEEKMSRMQAITDTAVAQAALGAVEMGAFRLLNRLGIGADMAAGHSYGEYAALCAAGVISESALFEISEARGRFIKLSVGETPGAMAAIRGTREQVEEGLVGLEGVWLANFNAPRQTIVAGKADDLNRLLERLGDQGSYTRLLHVACAFHTPLMAGARDRLADLLAKVEFSRPRMQVFSNTNAAPYPDEPSEIASLLREHLVRSVDFVKEIETMYERGARVFVEVGPKRVLTGLVDDIAPGRDAVAIALDAPGRHGVVQLLHALGQMSVLGVPIDFAALFRDRVTETLPLDRLEATKPPAPNSWVVNGARVRLRSQPVMRSKASPIRLAETSEPASPPRQAAKTAVSVPETIRPAGAEQRNDKTQIPAALSGDAPPLERDTVMVQFQNVMRQFLEVQGSVMTAYLHSGAALSEGEMPEFLGTQTAPSAGLPATVSQPQAAAEPAEVAASPEAVELPKPAQPPAGATAMQAGEPKRRAIINELVAIVSARTGYPPDMLGLDLNIEADLGIDSIKRIEILSALQKTLTAGEQGGIQAAMEQLNSRKTLREIAETLEAAVTGDAGSAPAGVAPPAAASVAAPSTRNITAELVQLVSTRTGYPEEMLGLDLNIEADLGIDSIKRVEILSAFQKTCSPDEQARLQAVMERLNSRRTLREVAETLSASLNGERAIAETKAGAVVHPVPGASNGKNHTVPRFIMKVTDAPLVRAANRKYPDRVWLITDDESGVAAQFAASLGREGERPLLLRHRVQPEKSAEGIYSADLTKPEEIGKILDVIRGQHGPIGAVLHLLPLRPGPSLWEMDLESWRRRVDLEIKSLYALARFSQPDLTARGQAGGARFGVVTGMGGAFATEPRRELAPIHAGVSAFLKTLSLELPGVVCKAVDLNPTELPAELAEKLRFEFTSSDETGEVGYLGDRRITLVPKFADLGNGRPGGEGLLLDRDSVVLLTGGARGITAEIAMHLAPRYQPTLILAGLSPLPSEESAETRELTEPQQIRARLLAGLNATQRNISPAAVEAMYQRLMRNREINRNLKNLKLAGARVEYHEVDVRDEAALSKLIGYIYEKHQRLDVVVHGAGIIEDKLIRDKDPDSFDRVVHTKVDSAFTLVRNLRPQGLKLLAFMSSVTATFGNRGQCDYAAANGVLNGLSALLSAHWPGRVVALNWGPWDKLGMVSQAVRAQFLERGIQLIPPDWGAAAAGLEMQIGGRFEPVVALGNGPWARWAEQSGELAGGRYLESSAGSNTPS